MPDPVNRKVAARKCWFAGGMAWPKGLEVGLEKQFTRSCRGGEEQGVCLGRREDSERQGGSRFSHERGANSMGFSENNENVKHGGGRIKRGEPGDREALAHEGYFKTECMHYSLQWESLCEV